MIRLTEPGHGSQLTLPPEAVTETFGILAARGAGKSNTAAVMAEEFFAAGLPFVVVDPVGSWFGLRAPGGGGHAGLPIPIFGGRHGDVPLERSGGTLVADLVVGERLSCVLDLDGFESEAAKKAFLLDFARRLYQKNDRPLHLFLEEADDFIPQRPMRDEAQLLRAWENIVRRGRARGLGMTLITQRSASVNKSVLTQVQTLIAMRTTGPQDRAAIEEWVKYHDGKRDILASFPALEDGEAWVWSPHFLKVTTRVRFRRRYTFDSGATPKVTKGGPQNGATLADVDLDAIRTQMAATIERAKADDPKALRQRVAQLERDLAEARKAAPAAARVEYVEIATPHPDDVRELRDIVTSCEALATPLRDMVSALEATMKAIAADLARVAAGPQPQATGGDRGARTLPASQPPAATLPSRPQSSENGLGRGELAILTAMAQHPHGVSREQLTVLTGYRRSSRDTYVQRLRAAGFATVDVDGVTLLVTAAGIATLGHGFTPLPTGDALRDHWLERLTGGERRLFSLLAAAYPKGLDRDTLSERSGYQRSSRDTYLQRLRARRLIVLRPGGEVAMAEELAG